MPLHTALFHRKPIRYRPIRVPFFCFAAAREDGAGLPMVPVRKKTKAPCAPQLVHGPG